MLEDTLEVLMTGPRITRALIICVVLVLAPQGAPLAIAQNRPALAVEFEGGWVGFADDGIVSETLVGGAARWYLLPKISIGPEIVYIGGDQHSHLMVTGNLTWDILRRSVTPFLVVGGGLFQTRETFRTGPFTSNEGAFTLGAGVRALVGDRATLGIDARVGWETHLRIAGSIGVRLGA